MTSAPCPGFLSAPPHPATQLILTLSVPLQEAPPVVLEAPQPQAVVIQQPQPQAVVQQPQAVIVEQAPDNLDETVEYWIEDKPEVVSNAVIIVDAATQWSRPPSRPGSAAASPNPLLGIRIAGVLEAVITSAFPVYASSPTRPPPPPPTYADSAPWTRRRPPPSLLIQRPRTRSSVGDGPLFEPLLSDTRCFK